MLSFGDPNQYVELIRPAGTVLIIQVTDLEEARQAVDLGADVIVTQGTEAGAGAGAGGGIADGRGLAAALALGAAGALIGTRFLATAEALVDPEITQGDHRRPGEDTERSGVLDIVRGSRWPSKYTSRTLGHPYLDRWRGRETELVGDARARQDYQNDVAGGAIPPLPVWAGEAIDLITDVPSAADLVTTLATQAEDALARAGRR